MFVIATIAPAMTPATGESSTLLTDDACPDDGPTHHGELNLGLNHGGCFQCSASSQKELDELCKATCLADPNVPACRPPSLHRLS